MKIFTFDLIPTDGNLSIMRNIELCAPDVNTAKQIALGLREFKCIPYHIILKKYPKAI
jgi:hypothetical protein